MADKKADNLVLYMILLPFILVESFLQPQTPQ